MGVLDFRLDSSKFKKTIKEEMIMLGEDIFADSQQNIINQEIVDRGTLLGSGQLNIGNDFVEVKYNVLYADVIEFGRNPGTMPPTSKIEEWVKRKGLKWKDKKNRFMTPKQIAFIIALDIKKNGTEPRPYLSPAVEQARQKLKNG